MKYIPYLFLFLTLITAQLAGCGGQPVEEEEETGAGMPAATGETSQEETSSEIIPMLRGIEDHDISVGTYLEDKVWPGTTILPDNHIPGKPRIIEVNMLGEIVWEYALPEELSMYTNPGFDVEPLPDDKVLMVLPGKGIYEIDRTGKVVWSYLTAKVSHDADRLPNGDTLFVFGNEDTKTDPQVVEVNDDGDVVWSWYAGKYFDEPPYEDIYREGWTHTNAVTRLDNGNTLISLRNFGMVVEVDKNGDIVREIGKGMLNNQHDPEILPDGNLLLADHSEPQRAIEIDGETGDTVWEFRLRNQLVRDANRLPNGNTLITGAMVIVEVTPDKEVVWQLKLNASFDKEEAPGLGFYKAERLQPQKEYPEVSVVSTPEEKEEESTTAFIWTSESGIRYENASVPYVYRLDDGRVRLYHGGRNGISCAISEDGINFSEEANGIIPQGGPGDLDMVVSDPTVIKLEDGRVRMYYKGANGSGGPGEAVHTVYSAVSEDGINFEPEGIRIDSRQTPDRGWASVPDAIVLPDGKVRIYYVSDALDVGHGVVSAISSDGLNFTREGPVLTGYVDPSVIRLPDGRYMMLAVAFPSGPKDFSGKFVPGIYSFISEDGVNFGEGSLAISGEGNIDPAIIANGDGTFRVYYWNINDNPNVIRSFTGKLK